MQPLLLMVVDAFIEKRIGSREVVIKYHDALRKDGRPGRGGRGAAHNAPISKTIFVAIVVYLVFQLVSV